MENSNFVAEEKAGYESLPKAAEEEKEVEGSNRTKNISELISSVFFICFSLVMGYVALTTKYYAHSRRTGIPTMGFPIVLLLIVLVLSLVQFVRSLRWRLKEGALAKAGGQRLELFRGKSLVVFGTIAVYALLWRFIGFTISSFLVCLFVSKYLEPERKLRTVILVSFFFALGLYVLFSVMFGIPLHDPAGEAVRTYLRSIGG